MKKQKKTNLREWCIENDKEYLIEEWDNERNLEELGLIIEGITHGSGKKVYWNCKKCGHKWKSRTYNRAGSGSGCPGCSNNSTSFPEQFFYLALKENFENVENRINIDGYEYDIYIKDINMLIEYDGYYYHRVLSDKSKREKEKEKIAEKYSYEFFRIKENNNIENNVFIENQAIHIKEYQTEAILREAFDILIQHINNKYSTNISSDLSSDITIKVLENIAKEEFENSLESKFPEIAKEWDIEKNGKLKPSQVSYGSKKKVHWKCLVHGHEWCATVNGRTSGNGSNCPYCGNKRLLVGFNSLADTHETITKEWDIKKNGDLKPTDLVAGSKKTAYWKCLNDDTHEWKAAVHSRTRGNGTGCPYCHFENKGRKVYQYSEQGQLIIIYNSIKEAVEVTGHKNIEEYAKKECSNRTGYIYSYSEKNLSEFKNIKPYYNRNSREVYHYNLSGKLINEYNSVTQANKILGTKRVSYLCRTENIQKNGDVFSYKKMSTIEFIDFLKNKEIEKTKKNDLISLKKHKKVYKYNMQGVLINTYKSINDAKEQTNYKNIQNAIRTKSKSRAGYIFTFKKEEIDEIIANIENDMYKKSIKHNYPKLIEEWNYYKNKNLNPSIVPCGSSQVINWRCINCNHEWETRASARAARKATGCPKCLNLSKSKIVYQYDNNNNLINIFNSVKEAETELEYFNISKAAKNEKPNKTGFIFSYIDKRTEGEKRHGIIN